MTAPRATGASAPSGPRNSRTASWTGETPRTRPTSPRASPLSPRAHNLHRVKVSVPEEKAYLFQAEVSGSDARAIAENIEFKLEENVPLSPADALFYFELLPRPPPRRASVSVVPRSYIERYAAIVRKAGMSPVAFEIAPKAIARAVTFPHGSETSLIVHRMRHKTGMHVAVGGALSFTSTVGDTEPEKLAREASKIYSYWVSRDPEHPISGIIVVGHDGQAFEDALRAASGADLRLPIRSGHVWQNAFSLERAIPPISVEDSLEYAVAAGLAFDLSEPF